MEIPFGKHKWKQIEELETAYLSWVYAQDWFRTKYPTLSARVRRQLVLRLLHEMPTTEAYEIAGETYRKLDSLQGLV